MRILFATVAPVQQGPAGPTSDLASVRYRVLIPAQQLARMGHEAMVASLPASGRWPPAVLETPCDVLVISKSFHAANEDLARAMKARGVRVVVDFCDDHFAHPQFGAHFRTLAALADLIVSSTAAMAEAVLARTGRASDVIDDPVEGVRGTARFAPRRPELELVWFGHPTNLGAVHEKVAELRELAHRMRVRLALVTTASDEVRTFAAGVAGAGRDRPQIDVVPWSTQATWRALAEADVAWIPLARAPDKAVKSANRLLESLWAGRLAVADALPAYEPFADLVPIGVPLPAAIESALADTAATEARVREAQRRIARDHSPFACGRAWARVLGDTNPRPLRLHLACGEEILPEYVNVDAAETRPGRRPDVVCDLDDLTPFADESVEEILAPVAIEDIPDRVAIATLREWMRVLRSGGRLRIERPDESAAAGTREALCRLLAAAGLVDVGTELVQGQSRERRGVCIAGVKPLSTTRNEH